MRSLKASILSKRSNEIARFLAPSDWGDADIRPLAGDASARRYFRLHSPDDNTTAVLMDAPPSSGENIRPFVTIANYLRNNALSAPEILATDSANGFVLMTDLGDDLFARVCASAPKLETTIYAAAIDALAHLHLAEPLADLPPYDLETYRREANLLIDWYLPAATGSLVKPSVQGNFEHLIAAACDSLKHDRTVCVLRDYHAENLLWLPALSDVARVGQLDFQDALLGHPAYDLVSLLEDARRDTDEALRTQMIGRFLDRTGHERGAFLKAYATLGAQRNLKIIGIFTRLFVRDNKSSYVDLIPRVWDHLLRDLSHPDLAELKDFITQNVPSPSPTILQAIKDSTS